MDQHYPEILRKYLGEERIGGFANYDKTTKKAADICGTSQGASAAAKAKEPVSREERAAYSQQVRVLEETDLKNWAISNNLYVSEEQFKFQFNSRFIGEGAEQKVYLKDDGLSVVKANSGRFHGNWLEYFNRLLFHAFIFPSTKYLTAGFTDVDGVFAVISEQPFAILNEGASRSKVEAYLSTHGFVRTKNDDYYNQKISVKLEDLHDENVFLMKKETYFS